jgi:ABC-type transport system involved in multi-copper enzyme maturation permease subunit
MRQVQESAIALALSAFSLTLQLVAIQFGSAAVFRDVDRRYTTSVLGLPLSRGAYLLGKICGLSVVLGLCAIFLGVCSALVIVFAASTYPSAVPISWSTLALALCSDYLKAILLATLALFFSSLSTSFSLPFFCTLALWLTGSSIQEAYEYVTGSYAQTVSPLLRGAAQLLYYLLPNFAGLDYHLQAVYALPVNYTGVLASTVYLVCYVAVVCLLMVRLFSRRELP